MDVSAGSSRDLVRIRKKHLVKHIADTRISLYAMRCDTGIVEVDKRCQKETLAHRQKGRQSIKKK